MAAGLLPITAGLWYYLASGRYVSTDDSFVQAAQTTEVSIDTYPSHRLKAHVMSLSPGTGSQFSVLPPENATGNWVKVVQRVPVRLQLDPSELGDGLPLHAGLSAEVTVDTEHHRSLFGGPSKRVAQR
jgi:membrane fusion protein (multidrug efflux system)